MQLFDPNNPNEKKKMIAAAVLALVAIAVLGYVFLGGGSSKSNTNANVARSSPSPVKTGKEPPPAEDASADASIYQPIPDSWSIPAVPEPNRNIFAFYVAPSPTPKPVYVAPPSPTPTPPLTASSLSPGNVYAGTPADFSLQVTGDKFTPAVHIVVDGRDLPTRFISAQQLFTTVPQSMITNPGVRQVIARSSGGQLYSNTLLLNVTPPPTPNYTYVGLIGKPRFNDIAVLQDKSSKDLMNVKRGDPVGGRFRVVSISEKEVKVIDTTLKIVHTLTFTIDPSAGAPFRTTPRAVVEEP